jgi:hypothetical protein
VVGFAALEELVVILDRLEHFGVFVSRLDETLSFAL